MSNSSTPTADLLAQHADWMRALARSLVKDAHIADDLAQDTMVKALEAPPRDAVRMRAWLGSVLRNRFREHLRSRGARSQREQQAARADHVPPADELVERVHMQRRLADALLELEAPYRSVVVLRFYEGLQPRQIARRLEVPVATVKSRLHRGLAQLRGRLDREYGNDRRAWVLALAPWVRTPNPIGIATAKGLAVNAKIWAAGIAVAITGGWLWWDHTTTSDTFSPDGPAPNAVTRSSSSTGSGDGSGTLGGSRTAVTSTSAPDRRAPLASVAGRVFESHGGPTGRQRGDRANRQRGPLRTLDA